MGGKVPSEFICPSRKYIREGNAKWAGNFNTTIFLFTDILLITKPNRSGTSFDSKAMLQVSQLSVEKCEDAKKVANAFKLTCAGDNKKTQEYTFSCETELERDSWIKSIYHQVDAIASGAQSFLNKS